MVLTGQWKVEDLTLEQSCDILKGDLTLKSKQFILNCK
jgi:hypothetical protein